MVCKKQKSKIGKTVKCMGLSEIKSTWEWYREKEAQIYEKWYEGRLGGDFLFRAERTRRWNNEVYEVCQKQDFYDAIAAESIG